jgi:hypothetical protein
LKLNWEEDGSTQKSRLEQVWSQTGKKPAELELERLPLELLYLREVFWDVWNSEGWQWSEVYYYQVVNDIELDNSEIMILRRAFGACMKFVRDKMKPKKQQPQKPKGMKHGR